MRKIIALAVMAGLGLSLFSCAGKIAVPPKTHPSSASWQALLSPDLADADFPSGIWTLRDGILTASEDQCIWTRKQYDNFILDLEFKTADGTNSGIIVHCSDRAEWIPNSVEIQIADDFAEQWAKSPALWHCGAFFGHKAPVMSMVKKAGEWNRCTVTCRGRMIYVLLNGMPVNEMNMDLWTSAKTNPDGSEIPPWLSKPVSSLSTRGHIGFQGKHAGAPIYFRNMKILEIE